MFSAWRIFKEQNAVETKAYIGMGSNLGDGRAILQEAWAALAEVAGIRPERLSSPYVTAPVGMDSRHWFTNAVGCLQVTLPPRDLLHALMEIEAGFGRVRDGMSRGYQDRRLDLDLLYYGDVVMDSPELTLPHPRIGLRLFVLTPLAELEPDLRDPVTGESIAVMEQRLRSNIIVGKSQQQEIVRERWSEGSNDAARLQRQSPSDSKA